MQRQRISEKSFWSYCCANPGIAAANTARTPATRILHARNCIHHLPSYTLKCRRISCARFLRNSAYLYRPQWHSTAATSSAKLSAFYRASEDQTVTTPATPMPTTTRSDEVVAKHKKYLWPSVTNYYQRPLVADRGEMQYLFDLEGRKYLDFFGGILTVSVGHCNPKVTSKINAQVNRLQHTSTLYPNEHIVALAEKIAQITPGNLQQSFFTSSGTEANEAAILIARMATGSYDVVALRHAYSGSSAIAKAITAHAPYRKAGV